MRMNRCVFGLALPALLLAGASGCASLSTGYSHGPAVDPAAVVQVNRQLQIPQGRARVYLLDGEPLDGDAPNTWDTYCSVLMQTVHQPGEPRLTVEADRFRITEVREYNDRRFAPRVYVATTASMLEDWPANIVFSVELRLQSDRQPGVRALICSRHSGAEMHSNTRAYYPDLVQIRAALGDVIEIIEP